MVKHNSPKAPGLGLSKKQALKPVYKKLSNQASNFFEAHAWLKLSRESSSWARGPKNQAHSTSNPLVVIAVDVFSCLSKQNRAKVDGKTNGLHHSQAQPGSKWNWSFFFEKILRKKFGMKKWSAAFFCSTSSDDRAQPRGIQNFGN